MQGKRAKAKQAATTPTLSFTNAAGEAARKMDEDALAGLRKLGFSAGEARHLLAVSADPPSATIEQRLRAALAAHRPTCSSRCSEAVRPWGSPSPRDSAVPCTMAAWHRTRAAGLA